MADDKESQQPKVDEAANGGESTTPDKVEKVKALQKVSQW